MKNEDNSLSDRFLRKLMNTSPDIGRGECRITFEVGRGLLIEGCRGILDYSDEQISVATCSRSVIIDGSCLCICRMIDCTLLICGNIRSVSFT
ncbi:MAG: YabP/YqfC family sporulation protein [Clostridia bacterium]|nr:YabP/YqfC family sporulation protein [Clostridia bacterium]